MSARATRAVVLALGAALLGLGPAGSASAISLPSGFQESVVFNGLSHPTAVRFASDGRVFVAEKSGLVKVFSSLAATTPTVFADLRSQVHDYWDRGLLGLELDPSFPVTPYVYVLYALDAPVGGTAPTWNDACPTPPGPTTDGCVIGARLSRLTASGDTATSEQVLIEGWCQQYPSHSIGDLRFGPDGALYVSAGEGASYTFVDYGQGGGTAGSPTPKNPCGDPPGGVGATLDPPTAEGGALRAQSPRRPAGEPVTLSGAVLRVDPATGAALPDNPLASSTEANARRIVAYGLRNPFRVAFRPGTSELWIGDVGWNAWEEVDRLTAPTAAAANFGWPCYEGSAPQPGYQSAGLGLCTSLYDGATTGTFGTTSPGALVDTASADLKEVSRYTAVAGNVAKLTGYISGLGAASGAQPVRAILYADSGGNPGTLLGVSNEVVIQAGRPWGWVDFTFPSPVPVQAGTIWLGYIAGHAGDLTQLRYDFSAGELRYNLNPGGYASAPSNPFGAPIFAEMHYSLYATYTAPVGPAAAPHYAYAHSAQVVTGEPCPTGTGAITGLAFYDGGPYPDAYDGALFFADFVRRCIWAMKPGAGGLPDPAQLETFATDAGGPVDLERGPGGDLFFVDFDGGTVRRIQYFSANQPPIAVATASPTSGEAPLAVQLDGTGSYDPDPADTITYSWDLDGDGVYGDSAVAAPSFTYATPGAYTVRLKVADSHAAETLSAPIVIQAANTPPVPAIVSPAATMTWKVGDAIAFSGDATDKQDGTLAPSRLTWTLLVQHCPGTCHSHTVQTFPGVASGSLSAPDHEYPSYLELRLTATDAQGLSVTTSVALQPQTVQLAFASAPTGLQLAVNGAAGPAPYVRTVIVGSANSLSAPSPQTLGATSYAFSSWSDGDARTHTVIAPAAPATYTATFVSNRPPVAVVSAAPTSGRKPLTVQFDGTGSSDPDGDAIAYSWDLNGDGAFGDSTAARPAYVYSKQGTYTARLRVTDSRGANSTASVTITVWARK